MSTVALRRSLHFVPGGNERMLAKALASNADALILDLEDALAIDRKDSGRAEVARWLQDADFGGKQRIVRVNPRTTPWGEADLEAIVPLAPDALLIPKVNHLDELTDLDQRIEALSGSAPQENAIELVLVATETPQGALNIATFPSCARVGGLTWGAEDLSAALGGTRNRDESGQYLDTYRYCRVQTLLSAVAGNVQPIDGVYTDFRDGEGLARECSEARWMGFTGKITIHPNQIDIVNEAFTPTAEEISDAEALLAAKADAEAAGQGAFAFRGEMIDAPHISRAEKLLARAAACGAATTGTHQ